MYTLAKEQLVRADLEQVWHFLKNPANLNTITPEDLRFQIISEVPDEVFNGLIIEYRIQIPLFGTRKWVAEIKHIRPMLSFVDEQRYGPYRFWYHYHELSRLPEGVRILDRVYYDLPSGFCGRILHWLYIRNTLERIFRFRHEKLAEIFNR